MLTIADMFNAYFDGIFSRRELVYRMVEDHGWSVQDVLGHLLALLGDDDDWRY
jgi:tRNA splicing endonuclease